MSAKPLDSWILRLGFPENTSDFPEIAIAPWEALKIFFVEANGLSGDQTSLRHQRGLRPPESTRFSVRAFFLVEDLISQLNIHHFQEEYLRSARNPQDFFQRSFFVTRERKKQKTNSGFTQWFWGWTRADAWKHGGGTQIRLVGNRYVSNHLNFLEPLWSFKIYAKYMVDTWKTSTHVAS